MCRAHPEGSLVPYTSPKSNALSVPLYPRYWRALAMAVADKLVVPVKRQLEMVQIPVPGPSIPQHGHTYLKCWTC